MQKKWQEGITLPELLITTALIALLTTLAVPNFTDFIQRNKLLSNRDQVKHALFTAKNQAVSKKESVSVTLESDSEGAQHITIKNLANETIHISNTEKMASLIYWSGFRNSAQFYSDGSARANNGRFYQCAQGVVFWQLIINRQGRIRVGSSAENTALNSQC